MYDPVMAFGKEEWKGASLTKQRKGAWFRSPGRTQGIEAALEGVVPALRTLRCRCSKHPTYLMSLRAHCCGGWGGDWIPEKGLLQDGGGGGEMCTDPGD